MKKAILSSILLALLATLPGFAAEPTVRIGRVWTEKTNLVVQVEAAGDVLKVTLESSTRAGRHSWEPRAVRYFTNSGPENASFTFTLPFSPKMEILRVRADLSGSSLPAAFYSGTNSFVSGAEGGGALRGGIESGAPTADNAAGAGGGEVRSVVESDIWKLDQDNLFFFNQYRGLQVIDVSTPDQPVITGVYDVAAAGEQMYLLGHTRIVLLARDNCAWYGSEAESRLILLELRNGIPELVKTLPVAGQIAESRLVGTALYVVANSYRRAAVKPGSDTASEAWEWGSEVSSYDLADFANASRKSSGWVPGYGNVITATDRYLFVAQTDYSASNAGTIVHSYDISSPDGVFAKLAAFSAGGYVRDKFKMQVTGDTFAAVVQDNPTRTTYVTTFSFADPRQPRQLARLKVIANEQLFATRFDRDRLYIVTFFLVDPLWIIDLSDPAAPRKVGELEIPGWSTYLQPLGDQLLAIGLDRVNGHQRTAVQLFDVANPAKPALLSKVVIGDQWSGSEANWDEKAFGVLPDQRLVLVPFHSSGTNGYFEGVQLIDLEPVRLVKRGIIRQNMGARRATVHRDRVLSLSSRELLTVDATDRDRPAIVRSTELSWSADQVHLAGDYVIELDAYRAEGPLVRVVDAANTGNIRNTVGLTNLTYLGSAIASGKLLVLQGRSFELVYPPVYDPDNYQPTGTNPAVYHLSVFDLSQLPALPLVATASRAGTREEYLSGQYEALEIKPGLLVWSTGNRYGSPWWWWREDIVADVAAAPMMRSADIAIGRPFWYGASGHLLATDIQAPAFVSEVSLGRRTDGWWSFSRAHTANGLVYLSHSLNEYDPAIDPPPVAYEYFDGSKTVRVTNDPPPGVWVQRHYLDVVDFNEPSEPLVRKPVNIPGSLLGLDRAGQIVFTRAYNLRGDESIAAASYDGVAAREVDSFGLGNQWPRPAVAQAGYIYAGLAGTNGNSGRLESWRLAESGKFELAGALDLKEPVQEFGLFGSLLVAQSSRLSLFDLATPARPALLGSGQANACYGAQLGAADGSVARGLWLPMGWYGVAHIPVGPPPGGAR